MDDDLVAGLPVRDARADLPDDAGGVRAADVVAVLGMVAVAEDRDRLAERRPDVVEVDAGGHDADDDLERAGLRDLDLLDLEGVLRLAFALLADDPCGHRLRQRAGLHVEIRDFRYVNCHVSSTPGSLERAAEAYRRAISRPPSETRPKARLPSRIHYGSLGETTTSDRRRARRDRSRARRPHRDRGARPSTTGAQPKSSASAPRPARRRRRPSARRSRSALASSTPRRRRSTWTTCGASSRPALGELDEKLEGTLDGVSRSDRESLAEVFEGDESAPGAGAGERSRRTRWRRSGHEPRAHRRGRERTRWSTFRSSSARRCSRLRSATAPRSSACATRTPRRRARCMAQVADLRKELARLLEREDADERVAEAEEAGTRKGIHLRGDAYSRDRADRLDPQRLRNAHRRRRRRRRRQEGRRRSSRSARRDGPSAGRIVFECKDKKLSKRAAWDELNAAMAARAASFGVLVVAGDDRVPVRSRAASRVRGQQADRRRSIARIPTTSRSRWPTGLQPPASRWPATATSTVDAAEVRVGHRGGALLPPAGAGDQVGADRHQDLVGPARGPGSTR